MELYTAILVHFVWFVYVRDASRCAIRISMNMLSIAYAIGSGIIGGECRHERLFMCITAASYSSWLYCHVPGPCEAFLGPWSCMPPLPIWHLAYWLSLGVAYNQVT
jgi:hypothetical protein